MVLLPLTKALPLLVVTPPMGAKPMVDPTQSLDKVFCFAAALLTVADVMLLKCSDALL